MNAGPMLRRGRLGANLSQVELARLTGTSQATISAYETGAKNPGVATLARLLDACDMRLTAVPARRRRADLETSAERLQQVLELAEALPFRRPGALRYPRLPG